MALLASARSCFIDLGGAWRNGAAVGEVLLGGLCVLAVLTSLVTDTLLCDGFGGAEKEGIALAGMSFGTASDRLLVGVLIADFDKALIGAALTLSMVLLGFGAAALSGMLVGAALGGLLFEAAFGVMLLGTAVSVAASDRMLVGELWLMAVLTSFVTNSLASGGLGGAALAGMAFDAALEGMLVGEVLISMVFGAALGG